MTRYNNDCLHVAPTLSVHESDDVHHYADRHSQNKLTRFFQQTAETYVGGVATELPGPEQKILETVSYMILFSNGVEQRCDKFGVAPGKWCDRYRRLVDWADLFGQ